MTNPVQARNVLLRDWSLAVEIFGAFHGWRTLTTEQLTAIIEPDSPKAMNRVLIAGWCLGLIDLAMTDDRALGFSNPHALWRLGSEEAFNEHLRPRLNAVESHAMTAGRDWGKGAAYGRHNILTVEVSLRAAAQCVPIVGLLGEPHARLAHLLPLPGGEKSTSPARADAVWITASGAKIAVELTVNLGEQFAAKVERWVTRIENNFAAGLDPTDTDVTVVFLIAVEANEPTTAERIYCQAAAVIGHAVANHSPYTRARICLVSWADWFPAPNMWADSFTTLTVMTPTGVRDDRWHERNLLTQPPRGGPPIIAPVFEPDWTEQNRQHPASLTAHLAQTPTALRITSSVPPPLHAAHDLMHNLFGFRVQPSNQSDNQLPWWGMVFFHRPPPRLQGIPTRAHRHIKQPPVRRRPTTPNQPGSPPTTR